MKRYLFTLLLAGLAMFTACTDDRDSNPTVQQPSTFELNMPALGGSVYDLANTDSIRLTYEQPDYGYTAPVKYYAQISVSGTWNDATSAERMTLHISKWTALSQFVSLVRRLIW